jgi:uncharacterized iron-regulated protein
MSANVAVTAGDLADLFNDLSQAIDEFRLSPPAGTTTADLARLKDEAQALENRAHQFVAADMANTLARVQSDLQKLVDATGRVKKQIRLLNGVAVGAAIATGNVAAIASTAQAFVSSIG